MTDQAAAVGRKSRCEVCFDLCPPLLRWYEWTPIQELKSSAEQGCTICSVLNAGMEKIEETKGTGWQPHSHQLRNLRPNSREQGQSWSDGHIPWTMFLIQKADDGNNPNTLQVMVRGKSGPQHQLEFYAAWGTGISQHSRILHRRHLDPILNLEKVVQFIQGNLAKCEEDHKCAPPVPSSLPSRVLDVGSTENGNVFLYETCGESAPYITLSHCWGKRRMMKTTKVNYSQRKTGIPWSQFPQTFRDAIKTTQALHIQYLWIDSLCIIQGDKVDWEEQSAQMSTIYSNCFLNLAATHSPDSNGGLFFERWILLTDGKLASKKYSVMSHAVAFQDDSINKAAELFVRRSLMNAHIDLLILDGGDRVYNVVESAPLLTRAWAYQERLLSPRTVNFHSAELSWDCGGSRSFGNLGFNCECGHLEDQLTELGSFIVLEKANFVGAEAITNDIEQALLTWLDVVTQFSKLTLTFAQDKLPALAGVAKRVADITQSKYLAGLWESDIVRGLLWHVECDPSECDYTLNLMGVGTRADHYRASTWSWASLDLNANRPCSKWINYKFGLTWGSGQWIDERFQVLNCSCDVVGTNFYGCVTDGHLLVKATVICMTFIYDSFYDKWANSKDGRWHYDFDVFNRDNEYIADGETIIAMLVGRRILDGIAILLVPAKKDARKYERVGIWEVEAKDFEFVVEMVVDII